MKKIINNKVYDTDTAKELGSRENAKMSWEEFEASGGTWEEFVDDVMHDFMGGQWGEINKEEQE